MSDGKQVILQMRALIGRIEAEERGMSMEDVKRLRGAKMPPWLFAAVREVLSGYHEREKAVRRRDRESGLPEAVRTEYDRLNCIIDDAVGAVYFGMEADVVDVLREDLITGKGWNKSVVSGMFSERMYYRLKKQCYLYIAAKMGLI